MGKSDGGTDGDEKPSEPYDELNAKNHQFPAKTAKYVQIVSFVYFWFLENQNCCES